MNTSIEKSPGKVVIISSPSGGGKSTVTRKLLTYPDLKLRYGTSYTTRNRRPEEINGIDYYFTTPEKFQDLKESGALLEWEEVYPGTFYGTGKYVVNNTICLGLNYITELDVKGAMSVKEYYGDKALVIYLKPPSLQVLASRLKQRGTETEEKIKERLSRAAMEEVWGREKEFDKVIINEDLDQTIKEVKELIKNFINND